MYNPDLHIIGWSREAQICNGQPRIQPSLAELQRIHVVKINGPDVELHDSVENVAGRRFVSYQLLSMLRYNWSFSCVVI